MQLFIDLDTFVLSPSQNAAAPLSVFNLKYAAANTIDLMFLQAGVPVLLPDGYAVTFLVKPSPTGFDDAPMTSATFVAPVSGYCYTATIPTRVAAIETELGIPDADIVSAAALGEINWGPAGYDPDLIDFPVTIYNSLNRDDAGPEAGSAPAISYFPAITALTGDAADTLDYIDTTAVPLGFIAMVVIGGALGFYQTQTGAANLAGGDVAPANYNAETNNVKWVKVL